MDKYALGRNIFDRLRVIKMSQRVLAEKLDIHEGTVSKWINGMSEPKASMLYRISRILGVSMEKLMEGVEDVDKLPPAQPEIKQQAINSSDCIDRQAAIDALKGCYCGGEDSCGEPWIYESHAIKAIKQLPPIQPKPLQPWEVLVAQAVLPQPEIVRCKDCKHWDTTWQNDYAPNYHYCPMIDGTHRNDFYCADAERREDG